MRTIHTADADFTSLTQWDQDQIYNGLDVCVTQDVFLILESQLDSTSKATYAFSQALQGPVLDMNLRGALIDIGQRDTIIAQLYEVIDKLTYNLEHIVLDGIGFHPFNWRSPSDLRRLLYDELCLPTQRQIGRPTTDRTAREKLMYYPTATQICKHLNAISDLEKKLSVLRTEIDPDNRIRTNYNIAGTSTGRFSSSENVFGTGSNLQNITESIRSILIPDPGMKYAKFDARSGESFCVGAIEWNLFQDSAYLDVCETGDPHTAVARFIWPDLPWIGDIDADRKVADTVYYRQHSYRSMCKKIGHGSNYGGKAKTLAQEAQVDIDLVEKFQPVYFEAFPAHLKWHDHVRDAIRSYAQLTSLTSRRRYFHSRRTDDKTIRDAIAYDPQCSLADIVNRAMLKLWRLNLCSIVMQDHDALTFMYPQDQEDTIIPLIIEALTAEPIQLKHDRSLIIPYDCETGWNKGKFHPTNNYYGLKPWSGHDDRTLPSKTHSVSVSEELRGWPKGDSNLGSRHSVSNVQRSIPLASGENGSASRSWRRV